MTPTALYLVLLVTGAMWGLTLPLTKVAVSTGHQPFGLIFWQLVISVVVLAGLSWARGGRLRRIGASTLGMFAVVGLTGTVIPNAFSYRVAAELPAGVLAIVIALVPMFALPMAAIIGTEPLQRRRVLGVGVGAVAVILIFAPSTSLPDPDKAVFVLVALIAPFLYSVEGNYVAWRGTDGLDPVQVLLGASVVGLILTTPITVASGHWISLRSPWGAAEQAIIAVSVLHVAAYALYLWMISAAGAVFASQVSYLVTAAGVGWSILILSERYSAWVWSALVLMLIGLALVQPRDAPRKH